MPPALPILIACTEKIGIVAIGARFGGEATHEIGVERCGALDREAGAPAVAVGRRRHLCAIGGTHCHGKRIGIADRDDRAEPALVEKLGNGRAAMVATMAVPAAIASTSTAGRPS